jgi:hypothetical protein
MNVLLWPTVVSLTLFQGARSATSPHSPKSGDAQVPSNVVLNAARSAASEFQSVAASDERATFDMDRLRRGQVAWREAMKSFHIDFVYSLDRRLDTPVDQRNQKTNSSVPAGLSYAVSLAVKGDKLYETYEERTPSVRAAKSSKGKTKSSRARSRIDKPVVFKYAFNGVETRGHEDFRALGTIRQGKQGNIIQHGVWFFAATYLPYGPNAEQFQQTEDYPPEALRRTHEYTLLPYLDVVDGDVCHVVSSARDIMWIDANRSCCVRRRVWLFRESPSDASPVWFVHIASNLVEPATGIWLPKTWRCVRYCDASVPSMRGKLQSIDNMVASSIRVNDVPDSLFEIEHPPGTHVLDQVRGKKYIVPNGEELLDQAIAEGKPIINGRVMPVGWTERSRFRQFLLIGNGVAGCMALGIIGLLLVRRLRHRGAS